MARKKHRQKEELLAKTILFRVTEREFDRLEKICRQSDCHSVGEVIRRSLAGRRIVLFHRDASLDGHLEELARIRQELKAIGVNINQITRRFHGSGRENDRSHLTHQALAQYGKVEAQVRLLLSIISQLSRRW